MAGKGDEAIRKRVMEELRREFRPEFLNRLDEIILFHALGKAELAAIVELMVREVNTRLADRKLTVTLTRKAGERLAEIGYDPAYGARPLRRAIQKHIQDPLAVKILQGEFREGDNIQVEADPGSGFLFGKQG
jgi:ATP-dependent Clp protease ATP-binding subunit ClpB